MSEGAFGEIGESVDGELPSFKSISQSLGKPRKELLMSFLERDRSVLNTSQLRENTTVSSGSIIHHLERLVSWGLVVEENGREYHGHGGSDARTWALTDRGETFCADHLGAPLSEFVSPDDIAEINHEVTENTEQIGDVKDDLSILLDAVADIGEGTGHISSEMAAKLRKKSQRLS
jgi:predicted ArsR family transcriptional regulator